MLVGVGLRLWQYAAAPSLWVDEAALARNVLDRGAGELLRPLDYGQVAPPGFLLTLKASVAALGESELALRVFPIVAGVGSVGLFLWVAHATLAPVPALVALTLFSTAMPLVYYSSNLKQYSSDVAATLVVVVLTLQVISRTLTLRSTLGLAAGAALILLCSQGSIFALTAAGMVVAADSFASRREDLHLRLLLVALWAVISAASLWHGFASMTPQDSVYLRRFWGYAFAPHTDVLGWFWKELCGIYGPPSPNPYTGSLLYRWPVLFVGLAAVGAASLARTRPLLAGILVGPVVLTMVAAVAHAYPFGRRVSLFLLPLFILLSVAGAQCLGRLVFRSNVGTWITVLLLPLALVGVWNNPPPYAPEHLRPVMEHLSAKWKKGDALWVYYGAGQSFEYYRRRFPITGDVQVGACSRRDLRTYLKQVDDFRGRPRVWILLAHEWAISGVSERRTIVDYLDAIGTRRDQFHAPQDDRASGRAEVLLYDLSQRKKLRTLTAKRALLPAVRQGDAWACYGTMSPLHLGDRASRPPGNRPSKMNPNAVSGNRY